MQFSPGKPKNLKKNNRKIVLEILRADGELSVNQISKIAHLSKTTIMKIVDYLCETGFVISAGKGESTDEGGKKPILYKFNDAYGFILSAQIFSEELYVVLTNLRAEILERISLPLERNQDSTAIVAGIMESFHEILGRRGLTGREVVAVVIGSHGITDSRDGVVIHSPHFKSWGSNVPIRSLIRARLDYDVPIYIDNWLRFQAYAELKYGSAKGAKNIVVVDGGSDGLAAGIIINGLIMHGEHFLCGEIGHIIVNPNDDIKCVCGGTGCFEMAVDARRLLERARRFAPEYSNSSLTREMGRREITVEDIFDFSNKKDPFAQKLIDDVVHWFAVGLSNVVLAYDPEVLIIQGVYTKAGSYFNTKLNEQINGISLSHIGNKVRIEYSHLGKDRGVIGGSAYALDDIFTHLPIYSG